MVGSAAVLGTVAACASMQPTNAAAKPVILVTSFGTSYASSRHSTIGAIESDIREAFPEYDVRRAFTAQLVIDHIEYKRGIRTDGLTMSIYSSIMVAATPIGSAIMNALLKGAGFNQNAVFGVDVQSAAAQTALTTSYIWIETGAYALGAVLIMFFTVEKNLKAEQEEIKRRKGL